MHRTITFLVCFVAVAVSGKAEQKRTKLVSDFEKKTVFQIGGGMGKPEVAVSRLTASQGQKSLRFEHEKGPGRDRGWIAFPVDGAKGFNAISFDIYCKEYHHSWLEARLTQSAVGKNRGATFYARLDFGAFTDGWTPVRLARSAGLTTLLHGEGSEVDWANISEVRFRLHRGGKTVFFLDNIRFENVGGVGRSRNMLYNSSFEKATNVDIPDGWGRDLSVPPFGPNVWGLDTENAFHGDNSLRIGVVKKFARYWMKHLRANEGQQYCFSIHLKSDREETTVRIRLNGTKEGDRQANVSREWQRFVVAAKANGGNLYPSIELLSEGALWLDAAQLETGASPSPYAPGDIDLIQPDDVAVRSKGMSGLKNNPPKAKAMRADKPPIIDGDLSDPCWANAQVLTPFVGLSKNVPARLRTACKVAWDDRAIYFAARADEPDMQGVRDSLSKVKNGPWGTDTIEFFLDLNRDKSTYYQFCTNSRGEKWEARITTKDLFDGSSASWRCEWTSTGKILNDGWTVEAAIPYTCFDLRPSLNIGEVIGVNICRSDVRKKEYTSWSCTFGDFRTPAAFGLLSGIDVELKPFRYEVAGIDWQRDRVRASVRNHTGSRQQVKATFVAESPEGRLHTAPAQGRMSSGASTDISAALTLEGSGLHKVFVRLSDETGKQRVVSQPIDVVVKENSVLQLEGTEFDFYTLEERARARCFIDASEDRCKAMTLSWWLESENGTSTKPTDLRPAPGFNEWSLPLKQLKDGGYALIAALNEGGRPIARAKHRFRKLAPAKHEVRINQWGRFLVVDGKPFLWYGFYDNMYKKAAPRERWPHALKDMKSVGSTAVMAYTYWEISETEKIRWALDQAEAAGIKVWVHLQWIFSFCNPKYANRSQRYRSEAEAVAVLRKVINDHKDHPALLGWSPLDEPGNRPATFTKELTEKFYRMIKALDPYHPCIFSHLTQTEHGKIYGEATDMALIPFGAGRNQRYDRLFQTFWETGLPLATNAPCYGAINSPREPTAAEIRVRIYKPLILGSRGFTSYTYRGASMTTWREFAQIGKELHALSPVLLSPDNRLRVEVNPRGRDVYALLKEREGKFTLIAVNVTGNAVPATLRLPDVAGFSKVTPRFGSPAAKSDSAGRKITATMKAKSTAVYEIVSVPTGED